MNKSGRVAVLLILAVAACGGSSSSPGTTTTATTATVPKGPPTAALNVTGDVGLTGVMGNLSVSCDNPGFDGNQISVGGSPAGQQDPAGPGFFMFVSAGKVVFRVSVGSGTSFTVREFTGMGVTGFDAATGAQIDTPLSETTAAGTNTGTIGAVSALKGSIDCGNFTAGTSTVKLTGDTADGAVNGTFDPVLVTCTTNPGSNFPGNFVIVRGITNVGSTKAMFFVTTQPDGTLAIFETVQQPSGQHQYSGPAASGSPRTDGATIKGDAVEQNATPPHTIHVEGDAKCGSNGK
jgi:hypothetical protein